MAELSFWDASDSKVATHALYPLARPHASASSSCFFITADAFWRRVRFKSIRLSFLPVGVDRKFVQAFSSSLFHIGSLTHSCWRMKNLNALNSFIINDLQWKYLSAFSVMLRQIPNIWNPLQIALMMRTTQWKRNNMIYVKFYSQTLSNPSGCLIKSMYYIIVTTQYFWISLDCLVFSYSRKLFGIIIFCPLHYIFSVLYWINILSLPS